MSVIEHIESPLLDELCTRLRELGSELDRPGDDGLFPWPEQQLALCGEYGVFRWFIEKDHGGLGWSDEDLVRGYLALSASCLTTTFIITQRTGACRRIINSESDFAIGNLLPDLISGSAFSTLGISHLTTSHRHLAKPVLTAEASDAGFVLNGFSPWVTGGDQADTIVVGATMSDGRQVLTICPTSIQGVIAERPADLVALSSSHTGRVIFEDVEVDRQWLLGGPAENVMSTGGGAKTGGLQTSTLAVGLASGAIEFLEAESAKRDDLVLAMEALKQEHAELRDQLIQAAAGEIECSNEQVRTSANSLVLRATQASLAAAKGAGFVTGHPAGRWCREALFFMVWSCPQPVMNAHLCQLAGIAE